MPLPCCFMLMPRASLLIRHAILRRYGSAATYVAAATMRYADDYADAMLPPLFRRRLR